MIEFPSQFFQSHVICHELAAYHVESMQTRGTNGWCGSCGWNGKCCLSFLNWSMWVTGLLFHLPVLHAYTPFRGMESRLCSQSPVMLLEMKDFGTVCTRVARMCFFFFFSFFSSNNKVFLPKKKIMSLISRK